MTSHLEVSPQGRCFDKQLEAMECLEYYGLNQGATLCRDYYDDFTECTDGMTQVEKQGHIT